MQESALAEVKVHQLIPELVDFYSNVHNEEGA